MTTNEPPCSIFLKNGMVKITYLYLDGTAYVLLLPAPTTVNYNALEAAYLKTLNYGIHTVLTTREDTDSKRYFEISHSRHLAIDASTFLSAQDLWRTTKKNSCSDIYYPDMELTKNLNDEQSTDNISSSDQSSTSDGEDSSCLDPEHDVPDLGSEHESIEISAMNHETQTVEGCNGGDNDQNYTFGPAGPLQR